VLCTAVFAQYCTLTLCNHSTSELALAVVYIPLAAALSLAAALAVLPALAYSSLSCICCALLLCTTLLLHAAAAQHAARKAALSGGPAAASNQQEERIYGRLARVFGSEKAQDELEARRERQVNAKSSNVSAAGKGYHNSILHTL
jgi:hypothetical protein